MSFVTQSRFRILDLSCNRIRAIQNDTFKPFPQLETLKLRNNFLDEIRSHYFCGMRELSILDLSSNLIGSIEENSFVTLESLLRLILADNCIINLTLNLPIVVLDLLDLSLNLIGNFPHLKNIGGVHRLDLSQNTNGVLNFTVDLEFSELERQKIARFATKIGRSIKSLNIAGNEITSLTQLKPFINLDELNLAGNSLDDTAANVFLQFSQLRKLNLTNTKLTSLDVISDGTSKQITTLSIASNPLQADFAALRRFESLQHLHFSENDCHEFESYRNIRRYHPQLTHISIQYHQHPNCKCAKKNKKLFSLYHIKFSTDWHRMCSNGQRLSIEHDRVIYCLLLIVFRMLAQLDV